MSTLDERHDRWSRRSDYREARQRPELEFEPARVLTGARMRAGITQAELEARMETTRSAVARLESDRTAPSTRTLEKVARAPGTRLRIQFDPA